MRKDWVHTQDLCDDGAVVELGEALDLRFDWTRVDLRTVSEENHSKRVQGGGGGCGDAGKETHPFNQGSGGWPSRSCGDHGSGELGEDGGVVDGGARTGGQDGQRRRRGEVRNSG